MVAGILGTIAEGILGARGQMLQASRERAWREGQQARDAVAARRDHLEAERRAVYANFAVQAGKYINLLSRIAGHPGGSPPGAPELGAFAHEEREGHASLIAAQWELRMIASPSMLETAEGLTAAAERVRDQCSSGAQFREAWEQHWLPARDDFITAARRDLGVEGH
jgi:putative heme iron utilization protein